MRPIRFRGKCLKDGSWAFGTYCKIRRVFDYAHFIETPLPVVDRLASVTVDPNTLGQFTGIHDRRNHPIYECDIVEFDKQTWHTVLWRDSEARFVLQPAAPVPLCTQYAKKFKVIGNVFDGIKIKKK